MLFKFCTLKLLLKTSSNEFLMSLKPQHSYNTSDDPTTNSSVSLYNRYLKGVKRGAETGFPRDLASCLWEQG